MPYWKALTIRWRLSLVCSLLVTGDELGYLLTTAIIADSATVVRTDCVSMENDRCKNTERKLFNYEFLMLIQQVMSHT